MHNPALRGMGPDDPSRRTTSSASSVLLAQLGPAHRNLIARHLLGLPAPDRRLRFGHAIGDASISDYVRTIRFARDAAFGAFDGNGRLIGFGHLAFGPDGAEFALSVAPEARRRGIGRVLLERAAMHARNRGYGLLLMLYMPENDALAALAQRAGMQVACDPLECRAYIGLRPPTARSVLREAWRETVAALDLGFRLSATSPATSA
jgi:GNAT superfamily N-acetyltransferase